MLIVFRCFVFIKICVVSKYYWATKLLNNHLWYGQTETNAVLVNVVFNIKFIEHLSNIFWIFESNSLISYSYLKHLDSRMALCLIQILSESLLNFIALSFLIYTPCFDEDYTFIRILDWVLNNIW